MGCAIELTLPELRLFHDWGRAMGEQASCLFVAHASSQAWMCPFNFSTRGRGRLHLTTVDPDTSVPGHDSDQPPLSGS
jgi:hypothetical protein